MEIIRRARELWRMHIHYSYACTGKQVLRPRTRKPAIRSAVFRWGCVLVEVTHDVTCGDSPMVWFEYVKSSHIIALTPVTVCDRKYHWKNLQKGGTRTARSPRGLKRTIGLMLPSRWTTTASRWPAWMDFVTDSAPGSPIQTR